MARYIKKGNSFILGQSSSFNKGLRILYAIALIHNGSFLLHKNCFSFNIHAIAFLICLLAFTSTIIYSWRQFIPISSLFMGVILLYRNPGSFEGILYWLLSIHLFWRYWRETVVFRFKVVLISFISGSIIIIGYHCKRMEITYFLYTILFGIVYAALLYILNRERRFAVSAKERKHLAEVTILKENLRLRELCLLDIDISFIDPVLAGLTSSELKLLKALCTYRESNKELGSRLKKSSNTVRVQLVNIMNKIGADNRHQLADLCKNYYLYIDHQFMQKTMATIKNY